MNWTLEKRGWWNIILFNMIQVGRNVYIIFNFFHECKFSPPYYLRSARTLVGKLAVISKQCQDTVCGVLDEICTFGLQTEIYGICIHENFSEVLPEIHGDGAMKSCSIRENKIIAQFLQPFNPCPCFVWQFSKSKILIHLHLMILEF